MRALSMVAMAVVLTFWQGSTASGPAPGAMAAEMAIREIVTAQANAWNAGDGKGYSAHVSADVSFTNIFGMVMYGRDAFEKRHSDILATFYKGTTKSHVVRKIRFVTADVAIVDIANEVRGIKSMPSGLPVPKDGILRTQLMQVLVRRDNRWWVEAYHNVDEKPARTSGSAAR